jgi:hypothetical protein
MRQWELFGITDSEAGWAPPERPAPEAPSTKISGRYPAVLWTTDANLRMRTVTPAASTHLGVPMEAIEDRELLDVFGLEGATLALLEAHVSALAGEVARFTLEGESGGVRCRVAPSHDATDAVVGTFCIAEGVVESGGVRRPLLTVVGRQGK